MFKKKEEKLKLTWKDVLISDKFDAKWWWHVDNFLPKVFELGYKYFTWNGTIYETLRHENSYKDTGLTIDDIK